MESLCFLQWQTLQMWVEIGKWVWVGLLCVKKPVHFWDNFCIHPNAPSGDQRDFWKDSFLCLDHTTIIEKFVVFFCDTLRFPIGVESELRSPQFLSWLHTFLLEICLFILWWNPVCESLPWDIAAPTLRNTGLDKLTTFDVC